jgi:PAS domain S-box-containing protein
MSQAFEARREMPLSLADNETGTTDALQVLDFQELAGEPHLEAVVRLAQRMFDVPVALVSIVDGDRQSFRVLCGTKSDWTPRDLRFCAHTILGDEVFVVGDATRDDRFGIDPALGGAPVRFYAGAPLMLRAGLRIGTLCIKDHVPRTFTSDQRRALQDLAEIIVAHLRLREAKARADDEVTRRRAAEDLSEATLESMDQGLMMIDARGIVQVCNRRAIELLQLPPAMMRAKPTFRAVLQFQRDSGEFAGAQGEEAWLRLKDDALGGPSVYERMRPNGTVLEVRTTRLGSGGTVRTYTDVTARRRAEAASAESEMRYRALADALPQMIWVMGPDKKARYTNRQFQDYYGAIGPEYEERISRNHPDDAGRMADAWAAAYAKGRPFEADGRLRRHDGVYRWHKLVMIPIRRGIDDTITEWLGTALDIEDIVSAREALEETTDLLRLSQEAAGAGVWEWDLRTNLGRHAFESARMYDLPCAEGESVVITHAMWRSLLHPDDVERASGEVYRAVAERRSYSAEFRVRTSSGDFRWLQGFGRVLCDETGQPTRVVGLNFDVTERKEAERALAGAKRAAEAASEAKSEFLASMSHEIRTPLNGILGYTDLLLEDKALVGEHRRVAERIQGAGSALLTVVNDILDFSQIEAGQIELEPQPFDLRNLIDGTAAIVKGLANRKGLTLQAEIAPDLPESLIGDADRLRQVLLNLLNNAVKFTPAGHVGLRVERLGSAGGRVCLRFAVSDTGIGIAPQKLDRLFHRFSQLDGSIRREFGGTGLGLAISKRLVELMDGEIGVESGIGKGSTFWIKVALHAATQESLRPEGANPEPHAVRPLRILLAEDNEINREIALAVLVAAGHHVDVVTDGTEAVMAVQAERYDLVLMDIQMPGMDGITATEHIRALPHPASDLPILAMTANVLPQQVAQFRSAGMNDHIGKPFKRDELYAAVKRWAGVRQNSTTGTKTEPVA